MEPSNLYKDADHPSDAERRQMWNAIARNTGLAAQPGAVLIHWRSFLLGAAASVVFALAGYGALALAGSNSGTPPESLDRAYSEAMERLLQAAPNVTSLTSEPSRQAVESRIRGIEDIDRMIEEIRNDMLINGASGIKEKQLRQLYAMKMDMVKDLVLQGEISL